MSSTKCGVAFKLVDGWHVHERAFPCGAPPLTATPETSLGVEITSYTVHDEKIEIRGKAVTSTVELEGRFVLCNLADGAWTILARARCPGLLAFARAEIEGVSGAPAPIVHLAIAEPSLAVQLLAAEDGRPLEHASLDLGGPHFRLSIESGDVAYSFTIDEYRLSRRIPAGGKTVVEFRADRDGTFKFYSDMTSDARHKSMIGALVVRRR